MQQNKDGCKQQGSVLIEGVEGLQMGLMGIRWCSSGKANLFLNKSAHLAAILDLGNTLGQLFSSHASSASIYLHESTEVFANWCCNSIDFFCFLFCFTQAILLQTFKLYLRECIFNTSIFWILHISLSYYKTKDKNVFGKPTKKMAFLSFLLFEQSC